MGTSTGQAHRQDAVARLIGPGRFDLAEQHLGDPPPGMVSVRILACGVCASDRPAVEDRQDAASYPVLLGHEPVGTVEAVGPGVEGFRPGMRVTGGFSPAFAEKVMADAQRLVPVPDELDTLDAIGEPLGCVVEARRRTRIEAGHRVAVVGAGYMGLLMVQLLRVTGAGRIVVIEPRDDARRASLRHGASEALTQDATDELQDSFDVVIEASGTQGGLDVSTPLVRHHGVISILGYHQGEPRTVDLESWNWKAIDVVNAQVRRRDLLKDSIIRGLELVRLGRIHPGSLVTHRFPLERIDDAFSSLASKPEGFIKAVVTTS